jgi:hypothetical protein
MYEHTNGNKIYDQLAFLKGIIEYKGDWAKKDDFMETLRTYFGWVLQPHQTPAFDKKGHYYRKYPQSTCDAINTDADETYKPKIVPRENEYPVDENGYPKATLISARSDLEDGELADPQEDGVDPKWRFIDGALYPVGKSMTLKATCRNKWENIDTIERLVRFAINSLYQVLQKKNERVVTPHTYIKSRVAIHYRGI